MTLKRFNDILTIVVVLLGLYIALWPLYPNLELAVKRWFDDSDGYVYRSQLATAAAINDNVLAEPPEGKRLVIPSIQLDEPIVIGSDPMLVHTGAWKRPSTSIPPAGGNTVITGHRFTYSDPSIFYHLDKIDIGDHIGVWWDKTEYDYEVLNIMVVDPSRIDIEGKSDEPILTLYTCTPIWTATNRLVIQARLISEDVLEGENQ
jgi:sortase A